MKKVFSILMVAMFATAMFSCSKDAEDLIIGTWEETEVTYTETINGVAQEPVSMLEPGETTTITFKDDHTFTSVYHSNEGDAEDNGSWSIDGDKLTITDDFGAMAYHIDNIDKKNMSLTYSESGGDDVNSYIVTMVMKMKRI